MKPLNKEKGFTLIELLIGIAISGMVISAIYSLYISQNKSYTIQNQVVEMQQNARIVMDMMVRDIRLAGYDPEGTSGAGFVAATSNSIQFTADLNGDGDTDDSNENITYSLYDSDGDGDQDLCRDTGQGNRSLVENISSLTFEYYDENGSAIATPVSTANLSQIRKVKVKLIAQTAKPDPDYSRNSGYRQRTLTSMVIIRNLQ